MGCKNYFFEENELKCYICEDHLIISENWRLCIAILKNCDIALDQQKCKKCKTGYSLVDHTCIKGDISNCKEYEREKNF